MQNRRMVGVRWIGTDAALFAAAYDGRTSIFLDHHNGRSLQCAREMIGTARSSNFIAKAAR